jgi:hypothetical protein
MAADLRRASKVTEGGQLAINLERFNSREKKNDTRYQLNISSIDKKRQ